MIFGPALFMGSVAKETFLDSGSISSASSTHTFTSKNLGPVSAGRTILVIVASNGSPVQTVTGITVDGVALGSTIVGRLNSLTSLSMRIGVVNTANTTGSVVVSYSGNQGRAVMAMYSLENLKSLTAIATGNSATSGGALVAAALAGGVAIAAAATNNSSSFGWAGDLTEDMDTSVASLTALSTASALTGGTSATATPTASASSQFNSIIATFR